MAASANCLHLVPRQIFTLDLKPQNEPLATVACVPITSDLNGELFFQHWVEDRLLSKARGKCFPPAVANQRKLRFSDGSKQLRSRHVTGFSVAAARKIGIVSELQVTHSRTRRGRLNRNALFYTCRMNRVFLVLAALTWACCANFAQNQQPVVTIAKLGATTYPEIVLAARVSGEVNLDVTLAHDGSVSAVTVRSGPPMLTQAAVDNAKRSLFRASSNVFGDTYSFTYKFVLEGATKCGRAAFVSRRG